jgi:hypothetical protein
MVNFRMAENNRAICLVQTYKACSRNGLFSCGDARLSVSITEFVCNRIWMGDLV